MPPRVRPKLPARPSIRYEKEFSVQCANAIVAGVDEAGRGPLAGPVVAAAVILPFNGRRPLGLRDSKQMTHEEREEVFPQIKRLAISYGIGIATAQEIDLINILEATRLAAKRALAQLTPQPGCLVTDCLEIPGETRPLLPIIKGDSVCASISAASILAKVTRDRIMTAYAEEFPQYGWITNKGYPTAEHYAALHEHGATVLHRMTFQGVGFFDSIPHRSPTFLRLASQLQLHRAAGDVHSLLALRSEVELAMDRLPPPDLEELHRLFLEPAEEISKCATAPPSTSC